MPIENSYLNGNSKFCSTCGSKIHKQAELCPRCGVRCADMENNVKFTGNINSGNINLTSVFTILGTISGIAIGLLMLIIVFTYNNNTFNPVISLNNIFVTFSIVLIFFSSFSGILGLWISSKNIKFAILEYATASIGISISIIISFRIASSIPFLSIVTGISPIFLIFLGVLSIIFFILAIFLEHRKYSYKNDVESV